jgi:hypothetical protein
VIVGVIVWRVAAYSGGERRTAQAPAVPGAAADGAAADGANGTHADGANGAEDRTPITDTAQLSSLRSNWQGLVDREVKLDDAQVADLAGKAGFWIDASGQNVFVKTNDTGFRPGQTVSVEGKIKQLPDDWQTDWNLPADQAAKVRSAHVYIDADTIKSATGSRNGNDNGRSDNSGARRGGRNR